MFYLSVIFSLCFIFLLSLLKIASAVYKIVYKKSDLCLTLEGDLTLPWDPNTCKKMVSFYHILPLFHNVK